MRFSLILLLVVMVGSLALNWYLNPAARAAASANPQAEIERWEKSDPDFHDALVRADAGDPGPLTGWYQRASIAERQRASALLLAVFVRPGADAAQLYRQRHRLTALSGIDSGNPVLNLELDNALAYTLVASPQPPTASDLEQARRLLPALEMSAADLPAHAVWDTVGCVHYQIGRAQKHANHLQKARDAFANAVEGLSRDRRVEGPEREKQERLYGRRSEAAQAALEAHKAGAEAPPLPLEHDPLPGAPAEAPPAPAPAEVTP